MQNKENDTFNYITKNLAPQFLGQNNMFARLWTEWLGSNPMIDRSFADSLCQCSKNDFSSFEILLEKNFKIVKFNSLKLKQYYELKYFSLGLRQ